MYQVFEFITFRWSVKSGLFGPFCCYRAALKNWLYEGFYYNVVHEHWFTHGLVYNSRVTHECSHMLTNTKQLSVWNILFCCRSMHAYLWKSSKKNLHSYTLSQLLCLHYLKQNVPSGNFKGKLQEGANQWSGWLTGSVEVWILFSIFQFDLLPDPGTSLCPSCLFTLMAFTHCLLLDVSTQLIESQFQSMSTLQS